MRAIDFSPLFRSTIGFDRIQRLLDGAATFDDTAATYPPYNIETVDGQTYVLTMAVAGFREENLDITVKENALTVTGKMPVPEDETRYLYRGIAGRAFERHFQLADHLRVEGASLTDGLLRIELVREVPEELKPRKIAISGATSSTSKAKAITQGKAA